MLFYGKAEQARSLQRRGGGDSSDTSWVGMVLVFPMQPNASRGHSWKFGEDTTAAGTRTQKPRLQELCRVSFCTERAGHGCLTTGGSKGRVAP